MHLNCSAVWLLWFPLDRAAAQCGRGIAPPQRKPLVNRVSEEEMMNALGKGANADEDNATAFGMEGERVQGLGFKG